MFRLHLTTIEATNFQYDIHSIPIHNIEDHYVLLFTLISKQDATENFLYPEIVREPLRLELNFTFLLQHLAELIDL